MTLVLIMQPRHNRKKSWKQNSGARGGDGAWHRQLRRKLPGIRMISFRQLVGDEDHLYVVPATNLLLAVEPSILSKFSTKPAIAEAHCRRTLSLY